MISRHLRDHLGGLSGAQVMALLEELADWALWPGGPCGIVLRAALEMVPQPAAFRRADGLISWRRHGAEVSTSRDQLDTEMRLLRAAAQIGAPAVAPERAAVALGPTGRGSRRSCGARVHAVARPVSDRPLSTAGADR